MTAPLHCYVYLVISAVLLIQEYGRCNIADLGSIRRAVLTRCGSKRVHGKDFGAPSPILQH